MRGMDLVQTRRGLELGRLTPNLGSGGTVVVVVAWSRRALRAQATRGRNLAVPSPAAAAATSSRVTGTALSGVAVAAGSGCPASVTAGSECPASAGAGSECPGLRSVASRLRKRAAHRPG